MDIRSLGGRAAAKAKNDAAPRLREESASTARTRATQIGDRSSVSADTGRLRDLSAAARQTPSVRPDAVARARELIASGEIDSPERLARAAEGFLAEGL